MHTQLVLLLCCYKVSVRDISIEWTYSLINGLNYW